MLRLALCTCGVGLVLLLLNFWLSQSTQRTSTQMSSNEERHFNDTLAKLLIPRWPGSRGHSLVCDFLIEELRTLGLDATRDEFSDTFPLTNVVGVLNPNAKQFLLLSCHYDSKYLETTYRYVGATDGAVSCAILLNVAKKLNSLFRDEFGRNHIGLLLVFFDTHDSVNGITDNTYPLMGSKSFVRAETVPLNRISLVISFNLIGAPDQIYMSRYERTYYLHERLADIEEQLRASGQLDPCHRLFYKLKDHDSDIDDDHFSFLAKGLPVMHVLPHTYPDVWLQESDNLQNLHWPTVRNMNTIITRFVYEYLN
ncbi:glutaminyl-peptide cyclotransferase [Drosophila virilis]|uniref:glutaminyl-peptide cyclotransferase n=1 Tax=Drosophila virilis TaxID=7244 RepID=B4LH39_DROVI|nr:glutaminyl-peptide cyclotransferase-like protein [Drosophila virilis]EDW69529.2 uncharacterized protein Dvir_GJ13298 [Drosophila virilis]